MRVTASVMGMPELSGETGRVETNGSTLAELWDHLSGGKDEPHLLAFVNGNPVQKKWEEVELQDDDEVLFMIRVSGG